MTHAVVVVFGENIEEQMAPYHEFECTGQDDQYVQDVDITEKAREGYEKEKEGGGKATFREYLSGYYEYAEIYCPREEILARLEDDEWIVRRFGGDATPRVLAERTKYGYALLSEDGEVQKVVDRTNPNKRWDWWVPGGRWPEFFLHRLIGPAFALKRGDIDLQEMEARAAREALEEYDAADAAMREGAGRALAEAEWQTWAEMREAAGEDIDFEKLRESYWGQPAVKALRLTEHGFFATTIDAFRGRTRESWEEEARLCAGTPYSVIWDGEWLSRGSLGWFGSSSGDTDRVEWARRFRGILDEVDPDTLVTAIDYHI